jgi:hypothetical protein
MQVGYVVRGVVGSHHAAAQRLVRRSRQPRGDAACRAAGSEEAQARRHVVTLGAVRTSLTSPTQLDELMAAAAAALRVRARGRGFRHAVAALLQARGPIATLRCPGSPPPPPPPPCAAPHSFPQALDLLVHMQRRPSAHPQLDTLQEEAAAKDLAGELPAGSS